MPSLGRVSGPRSHKVPDSCVLVKEPHTAAGGLPPPGPAQDSCWIPCVRTTHSSRGAGSPERQITRLGSKEGSPPQGRLRSERAEAGVAVTRAETYRPTQLPFSPLGRPKGRSRGLGGGASHLGRWLPHLHVTGRNVSFQEDRRAGQLRGHPQYPPPSCGGRRRGRTSGFERQQPPSRGSAGGTLPHPLQSGPLPPLLPWTLRPASWRFLGLWGTGGCGWLRTLCQCSHCLWGLGTARPHAGAVGLST